MGVPLRFGTHHGVVHGAAMAQVPEEAPEVSALHSGPQGRNGDSWVGGQLTPRLYCTLLHMGSEGMFRKTKQKNEKIRKSQGRLACRSLCQFLNSRRDATHSPPCDHMLHAHGVAVTV